MTQGSSVEPSHGGRASAGKGGPDEKNGRTDARPQMARRCVRTPRRGEGSQRGGPIDPIDSAPGWCADALGTEPAPRSIRLELGPDHPPAVVGPPPILASVPGERGRASMR